MVAMKEKIWIGFPNDPHYDATNPYQPYGMPSPYFRREFTIDSVDEAATLTIASLGLHLVYLNGHLLTDSFMAPEVDENRKRVSSHSYSIASYLRAGKNVLGIVLGDGWYASNLNVEGKNRFGKYPLKVWYSLENGSFHVESDGKEKASYGEIRYADNQNGECIDHRFSLGDFSATNYDDSSFSPVLTFSVPLEVTPSLMPPVKAIAIHQGQLISCENNVYRYDFGQNCAAVLEIKVKGKKGTKFILRHAERLDSNGNLYTENLRTAKATDVFVCNGEGEETFLPRFTFHGFRYAEIIVEGEATLLSVLQFALSSALKESGKFQVDNPLIRQLEHNVIWGERSNFLSLPTDCPQRDERLGWTGDAQIFFLTAAYHLDVNLFFRHYLQTMRDSCDLYGDGVPVFTPYILQETLATGVPGWSDAIISLPYQHYLFYGEKDVLSENYPYMERFFSFMEKFRKDQKGLYPARTYGDWLSVEETLPYAVYNLLYMTYDAALLTKISKWLGKNDKAIFYEQKFQQYRNTFRSYYLHEDGTIEGDTQSAYVLAYAFGLCDEEECKENLLRKLKQYGHLTTGFHSSKYLLPVLTKFHRWDLAYRLINQTDYPSWGYMVRCGATTFWERWDSYREGIGFNDVGMNSFNHYSLGSCGQWFYETIAGISPCEEGPGFQMVRIAPRFDDSVPSCQAELSTKNGKILVSYQTKGDTISYQVKTDGKMNFIWDFANPILSQEISPNEASFLLKKKIK